MIKLFLKEYLDEMSTVCRDNQNNVSIAVNPDSERQGFFPEGSGENRLWSHRACPCAHSGRNGRNPQQRAAWLGSSRMG